MTAITSKPPPGFQLIVEGAATLALQNFHDDVEDKVNSQTGNTMAVATYTVANLPIVPSSENGIHLIAVSDETGGATLAFSDGTNWRRAQDRAIVS